jgi:hypothetical protein
MMEWLSFSRVDGEITKMVLVQGDFLFGGLFFDGLDGPIVFGVLVVEGYFFGERLSTLSSVVHFNF